MCVIIFIYIHLNALYSVYINSLSTHHTQVDRGNQADAEDPRREEETEANQCMRGVIYICCWSAYAYRCIILKLSFIFNFYTSCTHVVRSESCDCSSGGISESVGSVCRE